MSLLITLRLGCKVVDEREGAGSARENIVQRFTQLLTFASLTLLA